MCGTGFQPAFVVALSSCRLVAYIIREERQALTVFAVVLIARKRIPPRLRERGACRRR